VLEKTACAQALGELETDSESLGDQSKDDDTGARSNAGQAVARIAPLLVFANRGESSPRKPKSINLSLLDGKKSFLDSVGQEKEPPGFRPDAPVVAVGSETLISSNVCPDPAKQDLS
jgi:hypothetical protein